jgi:hypothetical protein
MPIYRVGKAKAVISAIIKKRKNTIYKVKGFVSRGIGYAPMLVIIPPSKKYGIYIDNIPHIDILVDELRSYIYEQILNDAKSKKISLYDNKEYYIWIEDIKKDIKKFVDLIPFSEIDNHVDKIGWMALGEVYAKIKNIPPYPRREWIEKWKSEEETREVFTCILHGITDINTNYPVNDYLDIKAVKIEYIEKIWVIDGKEYNENGTVYVAS